MKRNKLGTRLLAFTLSTVLSVSMMPNVAAYAEEAISETETTVQQEMPIPHIESASFSTNSVDVTNGKKEITVTVNVKDHNYSVMQLNYQNMDGSGSFSVIVSKQNEDSDVYTGSKIIQPSQFTGTYRLDSIYAYNNYENSYSWTFRADSLFSPIPKAFKNSNISVKGKDDTESGNEFAALEVKEVSISKAEMKGPFIKDDGFDVEVKVHGSKDYAVLSGDIYLRNENNQSLRGVLDETISYDSPAQFDENGDYTAVYHVKNLNSYIGNGEYKITMIYLNVKNTAENIYYNSSSLTYQDNWNQINTPSIKIEGSEADTEAPVWENISFSKEKVTNGGIVKVSARISDNMSGAVDYADIQFKDAYGQRESVYLSYNDDTKLYEGKLYVSDKTPDGYYEVCWYYTSDNAGNDLEYSNLYYGATPIPDYLKKGITVENGVERVAPDDSTQAKDIVVDDTFGRDTITFTAAEGVAYEYAYIYEGKNDDSVTWSSVKGNGAKRTISVGNYDVGAGVIHIRTASTSEYYPGKCVIVDKPFTSYQVLKGTITVTGEAVVGNTITVDATVESGLEADDALIYEFFTNTDEDDDYRCLQDNELNTFLIPNDCVGKNLYCEVRSKNHDDWILETSFIGKVTDSTGGSTSGGNTSGGNTSGGNTSGGSTSGGSTSGGNTSGGNTSAGTNSDTSANPTTKPSDGKDDTTKPSDNTNDGTKNEPTTGIKNGEKVNVSGNSFKAVETESGKPAVSYSGTKKDTKTISVPKTVTVDGVKYPVVSIEKNAFKNNKDVTKVVLSANIKTIGKDAFVGAKNLTTIKINSLSLNKIAKGAFKGISKKAVIKIPKEKKKAYTKMLRKSGYKGKIKTF